MSNYDKVLTVFTIAGFITYLILSILKGNDAFLQFASQCSICFYLGHIFSDYLD